MAVVGNVNCSLERHSDDRFSARQAKSALTGLLVSHDIVDTHGPIHPDRQLPFSRELLAATLKLPQRQLSTHTLDFTTVESEAIRPCSEQLRSLGFALTKFQSMVLMAQ